MNKKVINKENNLEIVNFKSKILINSVDENSLLVSGFHHNSINILLVLDEYRNHLSRKVK